MEASCKAGLSVIAGLACPVCMKLTAQYGQMMLVNSTAAHMMIPLDGTFDRKPNVIPCTGEMSNPSGHKPMLGMWERWPERLNSPSVAVKC